MDLISRDGRRRSGFVGLSWKVGSRKTGTKRFLRTDTLGDNEAVRAWSNRPCVSQEMR